MTRYLAFAFSATVLFTSSGYAALDRFEQVADGIYRGDQPDNLVDYKYLKSLGIKTIINLRTEKNLIGREAEIAEQLGMQMANFPMHALPYPDRKQVDMILAALMDPTLQPVYLHCKYGKDRTGLIIGLYRANFERLARHLAWQEMIDRGFNRILLGLGRYFYNNTQSSRTVASETSHRE